MAINNCDFALYGNLNRIVSVLDNLTANNALPRQPYRNFFANLYAAEHLQIVTREPFAILPRIRHAGSIFLGPYAPVPVGDYASGTNPVLPTGGCARMFSGLSVDAFIKKPTFQHLSREALAALKDTVITLAESEGLLIHARAIAERFRYA